MKKIVFSQNPKSDHLHRLFASSKRRSSASSPLSLSKHTPLTLWVFHRITLSPAPADALIPHCLKGAETATGRSWGQDTRWRWGGGVRAASGTFALRKWDTWRTEEFLRTELEWFRKRAQSAGAHKPSMPRFVRNFFLILFFFFLKINWYNCVFFSFILNWWLSNWWQIPNSKDCANLSF